MTARRVRLVAGVAAVALVAGCSPAGSGRAAEPLPAAASRAPATTANGVDAARGFRSTRGYQATPAPARIEIPRIGVAAGLQRLGRAANGTVEVPTGPGKWTMAGWYEGGTRPGDPGSAVILGHVDSKRGPAVFYRLRELRPGDRVEVVRAGGSRVAFTVERVEQYPKRRFPTAEVYYPTLRPKLRLVTCGGAFNDATGHYTDNVIVFASLRG
jgi:sortase (surface protein transpeptidase)